MTPDAHALASARHPRRAAALRAAPGLALCAIGLAILGIGASQPAWQGAQVGPGLFARILGLGVSAAGTAWALRCALLAEDALTERAAVAPARRWSGPMLLGAVLAFALALPSLGIVAAATLAGGMAAVGAGERRAASLGLTTVGLAALAAAIGLTLLSPTAPLWPRL
jgi:hypothetical protein